MKTAVRLITVCGALFLAGTALSGQTPPLISLNPTGSAPYQKKEVLPEIKVDRSNVRKIERAGMPARPLEAGLKQSSRRQPIPIYSDVPSDSLAALFPPDPEFLTIWTPARTETGAEGVRTTAFEVSPDASLAAFAETTGETSGPNGTRLVLLNTHTWEVVKIHEFDRAVRAMRFFPRSKYLAALCEEQESLKQPSGIAVYDLETGKEREFAPTKIDDIASFLVDSDRMLYLTRRDQQNIEAYRGNRVAESKRIIRTRRKGAALAIAPGDLLAAADRDGVDFIKKSDDQLRNEKSFAAGFHPADLQFLGTDSDWIVTPAADDRRPGVICRGGIKLQLDGIGVGYALVSGDGKTIVAPKLIKSQIDVLDAVTGKVSDSVRPLEIRPKTTGRPLRVFQLEFIRSLLVFDERGSLYLLHHPSDAKKWNKTVILDSAG